MAESFMFSVAENLLGKIASLALQEVRLAWDLESDLKKLEENLTIIKAVLLDAEEKQAQNRALRLWLGRLKNFCYDAEDVLDELEYQGLRKQVVRLYGNTKMKVRRFVSSSNPLIFRHMVAHKVKELRERLDEIAAGKSKFQLTELVDYRLVGRRKREMTDSLLRTSNVVGRESDKEILVNEFLLNPIVGGDISVIPIVGLGGLGKTTIAKMLYNDERVDEHFDLRIWVCVSEIFEKKQIMVNMLKSTLQNRGDLDPDQLQMLIQEKLDSKKFLLVLDDVWSDDRGKWIDFMDLLKGGAAGSKVIVTTRNASVATTVGTVPSYDLKGLSHEQCLSMFKKLAFREGEQDFHPHLEEIGADIVKKCGGLPLAVKTMGTLLYAKSEESYWKFIRDNEIWKLQQNENDILPALRLSYDQMPSHLKSCFCIFSIYPKDISFTNMQLTRVWMAHGLLQSSNEDQDIGDIGLQYVKELYSRSFLQDSEDYGGYFIFKMHDLVHDLALLVAQSECSVVNSHSKIISDGIRHLSLSNKALLEQEVPRFLRKENNLRTIVFPFELQGPACESFVNTCISTCTYLRMLDLSESYFEVLPSSIGDLKHLRYLNLTGNKRLTRLPDSIWKLHNLETLLLGNCSQLEELPRGIRNLIKLRFLVITVKHLAEDEIGYLTSLEYLSIGACTNLEFLIEGMQRLTSLRALRIWDFENLVSLPRNLKYLTGLEDLAISSCNQLNLMEEDENQEDIKVSLQYLILGSLPLLVTLPQWLKKSSNTLKSLSIFCCENFSSFPEWFQDFTSLKKIWIENSPKLFSLPEGMHRLTALKELKIGGCPTLRKRCQKLVGEDWHKIAHVSNIEIDD